MATHTHIRCRRAGVTLVELLVALAIVGLLTTFLLTSFATTTRTVEIGSARKDVVQTARVALSLMATEIKTAVIDARNRDFVFVCADGLNSLPQARIEFDSTAAPPVIVPAVYGVGNAQPPLGLDTADNGAVYLDYGQIYNLYRAPFGGIVDRVVSVKPDNNAVPLGPPDRLDFVGLAANVSSFAGGPVTARLAEIRYLVAADTFNDGADNDQDTTVDAADTTIPNGNSTWQDPAATPTFASGDVLQLNNLTDANLLKLWRLGVYRALDTTPDTNPFSNRPLPGPTNVLGDTDGDGVVDTDTDPGGRYPFHDFSELTIPAGGELIGAFIYDLQFEFYGRIATQVDTSGAPTAFGTGWGYQDARGEDFGADGDPTTFDADGTQADGILQTGEDVGTDGVANDPHDINTASSPPDGRPVFGMGDNISDNDGVTAEPSIGEGNGRLDSRVMGVWDSRAPDPRNPRTAAELDGADSDGDAATLQADVDGGANPIDNDGDGQANASDAVPTADVQARPEGDLTGDGYDINDDFRLLFDNVDDVANDNDQWRDDRYYEASGKPEGVDEPDEADTADDRLPRAVRITIVVRDRGQVLDPVVLSTTVWLSTAGSSE